MTRERASKIWHVIKAYGEGKTIEYKTGDGDWMPCTPDFELPAMEYRIKPEEDEFSKLKKAYEEGKTIQHFNLDGEWVDCDMPVSFVSNHSYRIKPEESPCGECIDSDREIDCGKCDVQKELEQQHYRPFKNVAELIFHYEKHFHLEYPSCYEPMMWVKVKDESDARFFITMFSEYYVKIDGEFVSMKKLFEDFVFLDNSPCGSKE